MRTSMATRQNLTTMETYQLNREVARLQERIKKARAILSGQPYKTVRFKDAAITNAKIVQLAADKITTGVLQVGQMILVNDGTNDRVMITRNEFRISKEGVDVKQTITEANKKDFIIISSEEAHKLRYANFVTSGSYSHGLSRVPFHFAFQADSASSPTYYEPVNALASPSAITGLPNPTYLMVFNEGENP